MVLERGAKQIQIEADALRVPPVLLAGFANPEEPGRATAVAKMLHQKLAQRQPVEMEDTSLGRVDQASPGV